MTAEPDDRFVDDIASAPPLLVALVTAGAIVAVVASRIRAKTERRTAGRRVAQHDSRSPTGSTTAPATDLDGKSRKRSPPPNTVTCGRPLGVAQRVRGGSSLKP